MTRKSKVEISKCFLRKLGNSLFFLSAKCNLLVFFDRNIADFGEQHVVLDFSHWKMSVISQYSVFHNGVKSIYESGFKFCTGGKHFFALKLPKFSDMLTLSQLRGADHAHPLPLPHLNISVITPLNPHATAKALVLLKVNESQKQN